MLTGDPAFVMSSVGFLNVGNLPNGPLNSSPCKLPSSESAAIANCRVTRSSKHLNALFLKSLIAIKLLAREMLSFESNEELPAKLMNAPLYCEYKTVPRANGQPSTPYTGC